MRWDEIRTHFPNQWLLVEATAAHSEHHRRILDDIAVLETFPDGKRAMSGYVQLHEKAPHRELYVVSTEREDLEIEELRWLGIRGAA
ncbi:MAG: hypothetical protein HC897_13935 [Thermoanaerobaculia bacterium]|nr:hypothetical protein [Thermoanaerobaculia bacterium]